MGCQHSEFHFGDEVDQIFDLLGERRVFEVLGLVWVHGVVARGGVDGGIGRHICSMFNYRGDIEEFKQRIGGDCMYI
jgi:hypothetical protein